MAEQTRDLKSARRRAPQTGCCPLPSGVAPLPARDGLDGAQASLLATAAKALSDPIRLHMLALMTASQCCRGPAATEATGGAPEGVCVCELQDLYGLAQSKVSYHLKVLREAGLINETKHGKWSFSAVDHATAGSVMAGLSGLLGV